MDNRLSDTKVLVASDVNNPLCGPQGASKIYGPQKGATPEVIEELDKSLSYFAELIKRDLNKEVKDIPGAGAAGGLGAGLMAFLNAELRPGIEIIIEIVKIEQIIRESDLLITGEGRIDAQSVFGKVPFGLGKMAKKYNVPVIAIVGEIGEGFSQIYEYGINSIMSIISKAISIDEAMQMSKSLLKDATERMMRIIKIGMDIKKKNYFKKSE
jgi:glycerate kinase